ncbi:Cell division protein FtsI/penicillin-binding protein 2 [Actinomadura madurae]|uniref:Cell division protein FtsI/penicillin-binding protein 2 n=1 Tax=Actinomadura madurae TaxID=1993 RepID=A0A1I4X1A8_9ACTN|nr:penicillin-binding transpeptidase domain-containing protein [Actinomadura madurae]SFN19233.1 Cell division protein FtsI/penicillin-binding protein 2 [Actinomadura madurae]
MRSRGLVVLAGTLAVVLVAGLTTGWLLRRGRGGSAAGVAEAYFAAWRDGDLEEMRELVADPPADFAAQHRTLSRGLRVNAIALEPRPVTASGRDAAAAEFTVTRSLADHGDWSFRSVLRLGRVDGRWRVLWSPSTLYPGLKGKGAWSLGQVRVPAVRLTAHDGRPLPEDGPLAPYLAEIMANLGEDEDQAGWAVELRDGGRPLQLVKVFGVKKSRTIRTTLDRSLQAAAEKAVAAAPGQAAIVAVRPSSGEILAVADELGGLGAFTGLYPPGSTFKVVTAGALVADGAGAGTGADCPASVVTAQRTIRNDDDHALGRTTLRGAFAASCNTTFARLGVERLGAAKLAASARRFGFGAPIAPGVGAARGGFPDPRSGAELAEASIGQGRVQASPLLMATVAAAVADGSWRAPRLLPEKLVREDGGERPRPRPVPGTPALGTMMRAVVTEGTAARAGLPDAVAGKTGTAEFGGGSHAWFIGYRANVAFAVFVSAGGSGPKVAAPLAARFLKAAG